MVTKREWKLLKNRQRLLGIAHNVLGVIVPVTLILGEVLGWFISHSALQLFGLPAPMIVVNIIFVESMVFTIWLVNLQNFKNLRISVIDKLIKCNEEVMEINKASIAWRTAQIPVLKEIGEWFDSISKKGAPDENESDASQRMQDKISLVDSILQKSKRQVLDMTSEKLLRESDYQEFKALYLKTIDLVCNSIKSMLELHTLRYNLRKDTVYIDGEQFSKWVESLKSLD